MNANLQLLVCQYYLREALAVVRGEAFAGVTVASYPDICVHPLSHKMAMFDRLCEDAARQGQSAVIVGACFLAQHGRRARGVTSALPDKPCRIYQQDLCFHLFAGRELVESRLRSGAYLVTPGWLDGWMRHIEEWGFDARTAREFFAESASHLLLLDTGIDPGAEAKLRACADFVGLPSQTLPVGLDHFRLVLTSIVQEWRLERAQRDTADEANHASRKLADYTLAFDLLVKLTRIMTAEEAIHGILDLFAMLCGAGSTVYLPLADDQPDHLVATQPGAADAARMQAWAERLRAQDAYVLADTGFCLRIAYQGQTLGLLAVEEIAFPQHLTDYLNIALAIVDLCGLAVANARTMSQRVRAEEALLRKSEELARSNADLERFAYVASHDLQAPLRRIIAFGDLVAKGAETVLDETRRDYLGRIRNSAMRMQQLIQGLLAFSRVNSRASPMVPVRLGAVALQALEDLAVRIEESGAHVQIETLPTVLADEMQMYQLLQNLMGNALKFVAQGVEPLVTVRSRRIDGGLVEISVQDNGIGFEEASAARIFQPFQRLHSYEEYPGSGIGLAVCQRIVERHGGTIQARSRPGEGATFCFTLREHVEPQG